ncbi:MAG: hypothetical protein OEW75_00415 [Cyclobacteriaceae bacterium]|nr:hypothetical protein [Cyclobacteriaceae bacterium]
MVNSRTFTGLNDWQRGGSKKNDYLYNGKEMQDELDLGWMDYGARMYDASIGRFMVQDVMADAFFDYSPYSYTANNPLLFVDPTGNYFVIWYEDEDGNQKSFRFDGSNGADAPDNDYVVSFLATYHYNVNNGGGDALAEIACDTEIGIGVANTDGESQYNNGVIHWNSTLGLKTENNEVLSPATVLEHEGFHGLRDKKYHDEYYKDDMTKDATWGDLDEKKAIMGNESKTARANGETKRKQTRTSHSGSELVITQGSTSNKVNNNGTYEFS